ncbi:MAG: uracil-DNA glycosylase family protein [Saprospiraceae bacterium]
MLFSEKILSYHFQLKPSGKLPQGIQWLLPYEDKETQRCMRLFYSRYYNDEEKRTFILGINPGRFGAGITGIPFTDPIRLESIGIKNSFQHRQELSSVFIYDMIREQGGPDVFYSKYYIASLSPLGFVKDGKNYNYYDDRALTEAVRPFIISNIEAQIKFGADLHKVYCLGQGKNFDFLKQLNLEYKWWKEVIPLPHPRWIMQYKLKQKDAFIRSYKNILTKIV